MGQKANLVEGLTKGRTDKSSELNNVEANELIRYLRSQLPPMRHDGQKVKADKMRKKIISYAWQMNWVLDTMPVKVNMDRVNAWAIKYGYLHKALNEYTYQELPKLVSQFENLYNSYLSGLQKS